MNGEADAVVARFQERCDVKLCRRVAALRISHRFPVDADVEGGHHAVEAQEGVPAMP